MLCRIVYILRRASSQRNAEFFFLVGGHSENASTNIHKHNVSPVLLNPAVVINP